MSQEYFTPKKAAHTLAAAEAHSPALTDADEEFLKRITSGDEETNPTQQVVIFDDKGHEEEVLEGAQQVPLPVSPPAVEESKKATPAKEKQKGKAGVGDRISGVFTAIRSNVPIPFGKVRLTPSPADIPPLYYS
jgi:hypothetical protein